jgi:hypothetical protein
MLHDTLVLTAVSTKLPAHIFSGISSNFSEKLNTSELELFFARSFIFLLL